MLCHACSPMLLWTMNLELEYTSSGDVDLTLNWTSNVKRAKQH